jgi:hypothetical protein
MDVALKRGRIDPLETLSVKIAGNIAGLIMIAIGGIWWGQGVGYVSGSFMSGNTTWAVIGPVVAALGTALLLWINVRPAKGPRGRRRAF